MTDKSPAQKNYEDELVASILAEYGQLFIRRAVFSNHWEEVAKYVLPASRNTFFWGSMNYLGYSQGQKKTEDQLDATAALALSRFGAIMDSLLTPRNAIWHQLQSTNADLNKNRNVKLYFEEVTRRLFAARYAPHANFQSQNRQVYQSLGAFGNGMNFIDRYMGHDGKRGFRYKAVPLGELFIRENHQGMVDGFVRAFRITARQAKQRFPDTCPEYIENMVKERGEEFTTIYHCVRPREDYDPQRLDAKGKPWGSYYISIDGKSLLSESGYNTFPGPVTRYEIAPGETYGRRPAMMVLPSIKTLQAENRTILEQGHRTVRPVLLTHDDGLAGFSMRPGSLNSGGVNKDGNPLVHPLPVGNIAIGKELMDDERAIINDAFMVNLFQVLRDSPVMTATQVMEMMNEKGILLAPTVGSQQSDYLGPTIERELDLGAELDMLPPVPPELVEAQGEYEVVYTSPLSKAARAQEVAGLQRSIEFALSIVNVTQNPEPLDHYNWDVAIPDISDIQSVPTRWMRSPEGIAQLRQGRAQDKQLAQQAQQAPGLAAMVKSAAVAKNAGIDISGSGASGKT